jgi:hypothetical protein
MIFVAILEKNETGTSSETGSSEAWWNKNRPANQLKQRKLA